MIRLCSYIRYLLLFIFIHSIPVQAQESQLRVALEHWPPYIDRFNDKFGVSTEIVTTALTRAGYNPKISFENGARTFRGAEIGVFDVLVATWFTEARAERFEYSDAYLFNDIMFIKQINKRISYASLDDLEGLKIGIVAGFAYSPDFDNSTGLIKIPASHVLQNLTLLQQGKLDLVVDDDLVLRHQIRTYLPNSANRFDFLPVPLERRGLHMVVSKAHPGHSVIVNAFNSEIKAMKVDGSFDAILEKYESNFSFIK